MVVEAVVVTFAVVVAFVVVVTFGVVVVAVDTTISFGIVNSAVVYGETRSSPVPFFCAQMRI